MRKKLAKPMFTKGYKQIWAENVHELKEVKGVNGVLDDGQVVKLSVLQLIPKPKGEPTPIQPPRVERVEKEAKVAKVLKSGGWIKVMWLKGRQRKKKEVFGL